jgi:predicted nucleotide-binding protein (sugar kinase/HSP70/actin superfamily)
MNEKIKKDRKEGYEMAKRMNEVVKHIKPVDSSKVVLTSSPYQKMDTVISK